MIAPADRGLARPRRMASSGALVRRRGPHGRRSWRRCAGQKMAAPCSTAKSREDTSKQADRATRDRIAVVHNVGGRIVRLQGYFAVRHSRNLDTEAAPLVPTPHATASLGPRNDVPTPPPRRGVVVLAGRSTRRGPITVDAPRTYGSQHATSAQTNSPARIGGISRWAWRLSGQW